MKEKINKTNAARLLDKAKVKYELIPYEVDENDLSAPHVAESLSLPFCIISGDVSDPNSFSWDSVFMCPHDKLIY